MPKPLNILVVGAGSRDVYLKGIHTDNKTNAPVCFVPGAKIDVDDVYFTTGGGATNAAVTFARQGLNVSFMGAIGDDTAGRALLSELDNEGIDTKYIQIEDYHSTNYSTILLFHDGERTILTHRGASSDIDIKQFTPSAGEFDWIYVTNVGGRTDVLNELFRIAKKIGTRIMWNPGMDELEKRESAKALLEDVDVLLVNREEAQMIVSGHTNEELVRHCLNYVNTAIVTDGQNGVWASDGKSLVRAGMYEDVDSIDRTGAGDAFGSGFLSQLAQGASLKQAILFASANSTSVIQYIGPKEGILHRGSELHAMPMMEKEI